jgi:hypothetical protein
VLKGARRIPWTRATLAAFAAWTLACTACAERPAAPETRREVFVIGTLHGMHLDAHLRYTLADLAAEVADLRPDLVCAEVTPEHLSGPLRGLYPPEVAVVQEASRRVEAAFVAADWRGDYAAVFRAERGMDPERRYRFDHAHDEVLARLAGWQGTSFFDFIGDVEFQALIARAHAIRVEAGTEVADGFWMTRNREIVRRCITSPRWGGSRRVLFVFGMEHKHAIERVLADEHQIQASPVPRLFSPANAPMSREVVQQWIRDRGALEALLNDPRTDATVRDRVVASGRAAELTAFIEAGGVAH